MVNLTDPPTPSAEAIADLRITALERQAAAHATWLQIAEEQNLALTAELGELREEIRATREAIDASSHRRPQGGGRARRSAGRLVPRPPHIRAVDGRPS